MRKNRKIRISEEIAEAIVSHLSELSADSVEQYVETVLRERLRADGYLSTYTSEEEREVEQRLRDLGYLD